MTPLNVLYQDEQIIAFNKPTGLLSVPGIGPEKQDCLATRAAAQFPGARIVHRLDRDTSGVMVMALNPDIHRELSRQFHDREVTKTYIAIVHGLVNDDAGEINLPLRKDMDNPPKHLVDHEQGRSAQTHWKVLGRKEDQSGGTGGRTKLELSPITGRSHQLRIHLQSIGHPILGDDLYAPPEVVVMSQRLLLHAWKLWLVHPVTAAPMEFEAAVAFD